MARRSIWTEDLIILTHKLVPFLKTLIWRINQGGLTVLKCRVHSDNFSAYYELWALHYPNILFTVGSLHYFFNLTTNQEWFYKQLLLFIFDRVSCQTELCSCTVAQKPNRWSHRTRWRWTQGKGQRVRQEKRQSQQGPSIYCVPFLDKEENFMKLKRASIFLKTNPAQILVQRRCSARQSPPPRRCRSWTHPSIADY